MKGRTRIALSVILVAATGCDPDAPDEAPASAPQSEAALDVERPAPGVAAADTVEIVMRDGSISPARVRITSGRSTVLRARNEGGTLHELMIGREPVNGTFMVAFFRGVAADFTGPVIAAETEAGRRRHESAVAHDAEAPDSLHYQLSVVLHPADEAYIAFVPPADRRGEWLLGCVALDHFERGERGLLIVE